MIVYSVTVSIDKAVEADWLDWMQKVHVPEVMETGYFLESHVQRLLEPAPHDPDSATYNFQYVCASMSEFNAYQEREAPRLQAGHTQRYKDRFVAFRTILERL